MYTNRIDFEPVRLDYELPPPLVQNNQEYNSATDPGALEVEEAWGQVAFAEKAIIQDRRNVELLVRAYVVAEKYGLERCWNEIMLT